MDNTAAANAPPVAPQAPGGPVAPPGPGQSAPAPDPRDVAASSYMPNLPANTSVSSSSLSVITGALGYNRFQQLSFGPSHYLACFNLLALVISAVDRIMVHTYRFYQSNPDWHPVVTQMYYGIIFVVHILRVRQTAGTIRQSELDFLVWFESNYPLASLPIAGPFKHFFQSITVVSGPSKYYGNVSPSFPEINMTRQQWFTFGDFNDWVLPPIPRFMDMINDMLSARQAAFDSDFWNRFYRPFTHAYQVPTGTAFVMQLPGMSDLVQLPANQMPMFYASASQLGFPPRMNRNAGGTNDLTSVKEYLRFDTNGTEHVGWFPYVIGMMQRHAQFMKESTNVASISTKGLGACLPVITLSANPNVSLVNPAANAHVNIVPAVAAVAAVAGPPVVLATPGHGQFPRVPKFTHFRITGANRSYDLHTLAEQFSMLSCINLSFTGLVAPGNHYRPLPTDAQLRSGPYWDLPIVARHIEVDVLSQTVTFIVGTFHTDQRMTR